MMNKLLRGVAYVSVLSIGGSAASAAVSVSNEVSDNPLAYDSGIVTSLVTAGQPSLTSVASTTPNAPFVTGGVNNGTAVGDSPTTVDPATLTFFGNLTTPATVTFQLNGAYDITRIQTIAGWGDTYFGSQQFNVAFATGNSTIFVPLLDVFGTAAYTGGGPAGAPQVADSGFATRTTITEDTTGIIASNVTGVQFTYTDPYPLIPDFNGTVIRELSVFGTPVPEPTSLAAGIALAAGGLLRPMRRSRNR